MFWVNCNCAVPFCQLPQKIGIFSAHRTLFLGKTKIHRSEYFATFILDVIFFWEYLFHCSWKMMTHPEGPPTALSVFMTELQASRSVVGLIADNHRSNASCLQFPTKKTDKMTEKSMQRWVAVDSQRIDTVLSANPNSSSMTSSPSLDRGVFSLSQTNDQPKSPPVLPSYKAPFKPERRDSPAHSMLHTDFFPYVPDTNKLPSSDPGKPSSPCNLVDIIGNRQEFLSRMAPVRSFSNSSRSTPSSSSNNASDAPVCPRRKESIEDEECY